MEPLACELSGASTGFAGIRVSVDQRSPNDRVRVLLTVPMLGPRVLGPDPALADFLDAEAELVDLASGCTYELDRVQVEGGRIDDNVFDGYGVADLWVTSDGTRARFRVKPPLGIHPAGVPGAVRAVFRSKDGRSEIVATAPFQTGPKQTLVLPSGVSTSESSFYTGPCGTLQTVIVNADQRIHVGRRYCEREELGVGGVRANWSFLQFDVWLDVSVPGSVDGAPTVETDVGRAKVYHYDREGRYAQIWFDPRNRAKRLSVGRHPMAIGWSVRTHDGYVTHRTVVQVVVRDDGTTELESMAGAVPTEGFEPS